MPGKPAAGGAGTSGSRSAQPTGTIDRMLADQRAAQPARRNAAGTQTAGPDAKSPGMQQLIAQCKANRGVDCDTPQGMRQLQRENTPISAEEQSRIAGMRARKAACANARGALGC
jgi:hypothetical protein